MCKNNLREEYVTVLKHLFRRADFPTINDLGCLRIECWNTEEFELIIRTLTWIYGPLPCWHELTKRYACESHINIAFSSSRAFWISISRVLSSSRICFGGWYSISS